MPGICKSNSNRKSGNLAPVAETRRKQRTVVAISSVAVFVQQIVCICDPAFPLDETGVTLVEEGTSRPRGTRNRSNILWDKSLRSRCPYPAAHQSTENTHES